MRGVEEDWEEEETCPKTSPLTLTGEIKGPKNREKKKEAETKGEERENIEIEQIQFDSAAPEHPHRQEGLSPILTVSPDLRQIHQEQAKISKHHGNNTKLMEMMKPMRQEMQEKHKQLKIQLQLRDEYMDAELKRRDHNLEEALGQRDEECKSGWETREKELSKELRAREDAFLSNQLKRDSELL